MRTVGIRELRQNASKVMAWVKSGERVAVTERGKRIGYLVPAERAGSTFERLLAAGQVRPASGSLLDLGPPPAPADGGPALSEVLAQMRDEERF